MTGISDEGHPLREGLGGERDANPPFAFLDGHLIAIFRKMII
jgi:hypothetical protein